jgi:hypothetical protein
MEELNVNYTYEKMKAIKVTVHKIMSLFYLDMIDIKL